MKRYFKHTLVFLFIATSITCKAQFDNFLSKSQLGVLVGGSYYIGDLNKFGHFKNTNLSGSVIFKHDFNSRVSLRTNFSYGKIEAYDSEAKNDFQKNRNLSFQSTLWEIGGGIEFNYFNYKIGNNKQTRRGRKKYWYTPYMFIEIAATKINPKAEYNGSLVELQSLGTEGQGSPLNTNKPYSTTQLVIPFGLGFKFNIGKRASMGIEYGMRKTFTDYLDDVSGKYVNPADLAIENGNLAARLANRSLNGVAVGNRGNSATKDWYAMFGINLNIKLGKEHKCAFR